MGIVLDGTKGTTTPGLFTNSVFTDTYTDGVVADYTTGLGRISVGPSDGLAFYTGGLAGTETVRIDVSGNLLVGTTSASVPSTSGYISTANTFGFKNRIINGAMGIFQRGTPASTLNASTYFVDRWVTLVSGSGMGFAATQSTDGTTSQNGISHIYIQTIIAKASLAVGEFGFLQQNIEGLNIADFKLGTTSAKTFTLSFRANASTPTTASVAIRNGANNRSYVTTVALTTTPTNYSITVPGDTAGTWAVDNTAGMSVSFCFAANTAGTFTTSTLNAWQAGNYIAANTQSNGFDTLNRYMNITDVQLEKGTVATAFDFRPYSTELMLCQRYATIFSGIVLASGATSPTQFYFPVPMRVAPTISNVVFNAGTGGGIATLNYLGAYQTANHSGTSGFTALATAEL